MKKFISILLFFAVFAFLGCDNLANSGEDGKGDGNNNTQEGEWQWRV